MADIGQIWRFPGLSGVVTVVMLSFGLWACATQVAPDTAAPGNPGFIGVISADEPRAVLAGQEMLRSGGNAADAAAAMGLSLAVTLPSRAGLGGGGLCTVYDTALAKAEVLDFLIRDDKNIPMLARGLAALQSRYGKRPWSNAVAPAEALARFGFTVSKMLADDLAKNAGRLMNDPAALRAFMDRQRQFVTAGAEIKLLTLADTMALLRMRGAAAQSSVPPVWSQANTTEQGDFMVYGPSAIDGSTTPQDMASTAFVVGDRNGLAVACALTMGSAFGRGVMAAEGGYLYGVRHTAPRQLQAFVAADARYSQVVLAAVAHGNRALELRHSLITNWLLNEKPYEAMRAEVQALSEDGVQGDVSAAVCLGGLALVGKECRTLADVRGFGLGKTLGPEDRQ